MTREVTAIQVHPLVKQRLSKLLDIEQKKNPIENITYQKLLIKLMDTYETTPNES